MEPANAESIALEREHALDRVESTELERDEQLDRIEAKLDRLDERLSALEQAAMAMQGAVEQAQAHPMLGQFLGNGGDGH